MPRKTNKRPQESSLYTQAKRQNLTKDSKKIPNPSPPIEEEYEQIPQFFVKWIGYADIHNTWEPLENLSNCKELLRDFLLSRCKKNTINNPSLAAAVAETETAEAETESTSTDMDVDRNREDKEKEDKGKKDKKDRDKEHRDEEDREEEDMFTASSLLNSRLSLPKSKSRTLPPVPVPVSASIATTTTIITTTTASSSVQPSLRRKLRRSIISKAEIQTITRTLNEAEILTEKHISAKNHAIRLKAFEDIFKNSTGPKISIENTVDDAACPPGFKYISECIYGKGVEKPDPQFSSRCECKSGECSIEMGCPCMQEAAEINDYKTLPFEMDGTVSELASRLLWECNAGCSCGPSCVSRVSQQGRRFAMMIKRYPNKGWGVVLNQKEPIPPRTFVARYTGEIILNQEADIRGQEYDQGGATWLFDLDYNTELEAKYSIDAYKQGNESHFFNHSCDPNLSVYMLVGGDTGGDEDMMTLSFWSNRWIHEGEELTFDYNGNYVQPWLDDKVARGQSQRSKNKKGKTPCLCGASKCKKWVYL
ncbi:histone H3-K9 methyltransferase KMT1 [Haplosporangium sp. Z 27]|nr:histone H3-K9 methyltransferase KMT1 [Haplosporangium sp. Z 27]